MWAAEFIWVYWAPGETNYKTSVQDWHHLATTRACRIYNVCVKYSFYTGETTVFWAPVPSGNPQWTVSTSCVHPVEAGRAECCSAADTLLLLLHRCSQDRCRYFITTALQCCQLKLSFSARIFLYLQGEPLAFVVPSQEHARKWGEKPERSLRNCKFLPVNHPSLSQCTWTMYQSQWNCSRS